MTFPLLDLHACYLDTQRNLAELVTLAHTLYEESEQPWQEMYSLFITARGVHDILLHAMPGSLRQQIGDEQAACDALCEWGLEVLRDSPEAPAAPTHTPPLG